MKKFIFTLGLTALFFMPAALAAGNEPLRVATYNIRYDNPGDSINDWAHRKDRVKGLIRFHEFDLFGIQEGLANQVADLAGMTEYGHYGVGREDGMSKGECMTIFYRKDRLEMLDRGTFWLSETPDVVSRGWGAQLHRTCTWAKMRDLATGKEFYFFNTHLDHRTPEARTGGAQLIVDRIASMTGGKYPVICTGDFNSGPDSDPIRIMKSGLRSSRDVTVEPPYGSVGTFCSFAVDGRLTSEIDYIFVNDRVKVLKYGVLTDSNGQYYPSDHHPLLIKAVLE